MNKFLDQVKNGISVKLCGSRLSPENLLQKTEIGENECDTYLQHYLTTTKVKILNSTRHNITFNTNTVQLIFHTEVRYSSSQ